MPKYLIRRIETTVKEAVIEADNEQDARDACAELDYESFTPADYLLESQTVCEGLAEDNETDGVVELEAEYIRNIECDCGEWECFPADMPRDKCQTFEHVKNLEDENEAVYKCLQCEKETTSKVALEVKED